MMDRREEWFLENLKFESRNDKVACCWIRLQTENEDESDGIKELIGKSYRRLGLIEKSL